MNTPKNFNHLVGIIGGTGPEATNYFTSLLIKQRGHVRHDQEHIPFLVYNNPQIPDRSKYLLYGGEHPLPELVRTGAFLKKAGATFLVITCNTAHAFTPDIEQNVGIPVLSLVDETVKFVSENYGKAAKVGVLATTGTIKTNIYQQAFGRIAPDVSIVVPDEKTQAEVMKACYDIKKFSADEQSFQLLYKAAHKLKDQGAQVIILGCTEIPLALTEEKCDFERIDPMEILANKVIDRTLMGHLSIYRKILNKIQHPQPKVAISK